MKAKSPIQLFAVALAILAGITMQAFMKTGNKPAVDGQGHVLTSLWKAYYAAEKADLPKKMAESLEAVKEEAKARRYHWDFYDAAARIVDVEASRDWKKRAGLQERLMKEVEEYGEPIVTLAFQCNFGTCPDVDFVLVNRARLQAGKNGPFYTRTAGEMGGHLNHFIKDDYEYALWAVLLQTSGRDKAAEALEACLGDAYPNAPWLEFCKARNGAWSGRKEAMEAFVDKYGGKAVNLFGKSVLFDLKLQELRDKDAGEEEYKALYSAIQAAEKERKSYSAGVDGRLAADFDDFKYHLRTLESKEISIMFKDGGMLVLLRNLDKVDLSIVPDVKGASPILKGTYHNPRRSFYILDTIKVDIPRCDDGNYSVEAKSGKIVGKARYAPRTLSIASRADSEGWKFYVADYMTGKPVESVDLALTLNGRSVAVEKDVAVDGFTPLPASIAAAMKAEAYHNLVASTRDSGGFLRESNGLALTTFERRQVAKETSSTFCNLFTDKSAYNPGETLKFKAVLYSGDMRRSLRVLEAGEEVSAELHDAEDRKVGSLDLVTGEYGSVAGEFAIPVGGRNGRFRLAIVREHTLASKRIVVDEFILPTYDLVFDKVDDLYFMGDEICVGGKLASYSGHPLDAAEVSYTVDSWGSRVSSGALKVGPDGSFSIRFRSQEDMYRYDVKVKVKDATGETKEFSRTVHVLDYFTIDLGLDNAAKGNARLQADGWSGCSLLSGGKAVVTFTARNNDGQAVPLPVSYELLDAGGKVLESGSAMSGESKELSLPAPGRYSLKAKSTGKSDKGREVSSQNVLEILRVDDSDAILAAPVENVFKLVGPCADGSLKDGEDISVQFGAGCGPVWAVVELFGDKRQPLRRQLVHLEGRAGEEGSLTTLSYGYGPDFPDAVYMAIFYFRKGRHFSFSREFRREKAVADLPLSFASFADKALPGKEYSLTIQSAPGVEAVAAVFDKSSETIAPNRWETVKLQDRGAQAVYFQVQDGGISYDGGMVAFGSTLVRGLGDARYKTRSAEYPAMAANAVEMAVSGVAMDEDAVQSPDAAPAEGDSPDALAEDVDIRSDFSSSLAFEPFLRSDAEGNILFKFATSEKLSTFVVQVYAHTKDMENAVIRREMTVSVPVKVSVAEPKYLYRGDKWVLHVSVSNVSDAPVAGQVALQAYPSSDYKASKPFSSASKKVAVPAGGSVAVEFGLDPKDCDELGLKVVFADKDKAFSDGVFVSFPVYDAGQTLAEAHSAVVLPGMDKDAVLKRLKGEFTGTTSKGAEYKEIDISRMLMDAIPSKVEPSGKDLLSLSEAFYVRRLAAKLGSPALASGSSEGQSPDLWTKMMACRNADGGFGWFEGMRSSPVITAVLLEHLAKMRDAGLLAGDFDPAPSVAFLDREQFIYPGQRPYWCGSLSMEQYAHVRSIYSSVPFDVQDRTPSEQNDYSRNFKEFKKAVKDYLVPSAKDGRGLEGRILAKARRIKTLVNLVHNDGGPALASKWGVEFPGGSKMEGSISADMASLYEYAVEHRDGGWYYPNAVMPWRGLLEGELYAHSLLCDLLSDNRVASSAPGPAEGRWTIPDGIRIWIMLQKETQQWAQDAAYVDAINSVLSGSPEVLSTKVVLMTKTYRIPFRNVVAAGNGFAIERHFYKEVTGEGGKLGRLEIHPGMRLFFGDKVIAEYKVWNQENRSFVKLSAPREAAFRPVDQLSGHYGRWMRPLSVGTYSYSPQGYRNVKADCTEYFFDVYPEEDTTVTEEFFITQEGTFAAPVVAIESLYAPHYRANGKFGGDLKTE